MCAIWVGFQFMAQYLTVVLSNNIISLKFKFSFFTLGGNVDGIRRCNLVALLYKPQTNLTKEIEKTNFPPTFAMPYTVGWAL